MACLPTPTLAVESTRNECLRMAQIQWYPGHIAKMERQLANQLKLVDVVVEIVDARIPASTTNLRLHQRLVHKPVLFLLNKTDLGDPAINQRWLHYFSETHGHAMLYDTVSAGKHKKELVSAVLRLGEEKMRALEAKGMRRRAIRALVIGMPNVGKSSVINHIVGKKKTQTGHRAGVTREPQWVRIHPSVELLDSPGIIPPVLESDEVGLLLATVSSVGEAAVDDETIARFLLERIDPLYPGHLHSVYGIPPEIPMSFEALAEQRHYKASGGRLDTNRAIQALLTDFRQGRLGRLSLERPNESVPPSVASVSEISQ